MCVSFRYVSEIRPDSALFFFAMSYSFVIFNGQVRSCLRERLNHLCFSYLPRCRQSQLCSCLFKIYRLEEQNTSSEHTVLEHRGTGGIMTGRDRMVCLH